MPSFTYLGDTYEYDIRRGRRKTLGIYVHPDLRIEVRAPEDAEEEAIAAVVHKRRAWIVRQRQAFGLYHPLRRLPLYVSGATHLYLGRQYRLKLAEGTKNSVKLSGGYLYVTHHPRSSPEKALQSWYSERADHWFPQLLEEVYPRFRAYAIPKPTITHRQLSKRWGSCQVSEHRLLLNTELIQGPKVGIEYVIAHELAHLVEPHHTPAFYAILDRVMPDWSRWKGKLEEVCG